MRRLQTEPSLLGRLFAPIIGAILLVLGFMFSMVLQAFVAVLGLSAFAYFWWKTRALRRALRERAADGGADGQVIEGEAVVVEYSEQTRRNIPITGR